VLGVLEGSRKWSALAVKIARGMPIARMTAVISKPDAQMTTNTEKDDKKVAAGVEAEVSRLAKLEASAATAARRIACRIGAALVHSQHGDLGVPSWVSVFIALKVWQPRH